MLEATVRNEGRQTVEVAERAVSDMGTHLSSLFHVDHIRMFEHRGGTHTHPVHRLRIPERNQGAQKGIAKLTERYIKLMMRVK
jgi:hypothetical protein